MQIALSVAENVAKEKKPNAKMCLQEIGSKDAQNDHARFCHDVPAKRCCVEICFVECGAGREIGSKENCCRIGGDQSCSAAKMQRRRNATPASL